jgi:hydrogenase maturation protein HypF
MAASVLHTLGRGDEIVDRLRQPETAAVAQMLARGFNTPPSTACGRLFDAAAGLLGVRAFNSFEGEAAMALEALCRQPRSLESGWRMVSNVDMPDVLDFTPLLHALLDRDPVEGAELFHGTLAAGLAEFALQRLDGQQRLAVCGGCAVNRPLIETLRAHLARHGVELLIPRQLPPGDGGLALGQALIARRRLAEGG